MASNSARVLNVSLRFGTLVIRFLFVFFLAKYLDAASVGYYGLFTAIIGFALYFAGMDFYIYVSREILRTSDGQRGRMLKGQAALSGLLYLALLPFAAVFLSQADWPAHLVWWFFPILVLEHFNQEVSRLLIVLSKQVTASLILFIRQGSWAIAVVALMSWNADSRNLDVVMALWTCAGIAAAALGSWKLTRLQLGGWREPIDWGWIRKGIAVSAVFLVATLAVRGVQTVDRFWLKDLVDIEMVAAYVLFLGVAGSLMVFLDAAVFFFTYPALISHNHKNENDLARTKVRQMFFQTVAFSAAFAIVSWILLPYLLNWVGNPVYQNALGLYPWVLAATTLNAISMVPHYALYARGRDRPIIWSHIAALPAFALSTWAISQIDPVLAVPASLVTAFGLILAWKTLAYWKIISSEDRPKPSPQIVQN